jgi:hypothetical protein
MEMELLADILMQNGGDMGKSAETACSISLEVSEHVVDTRGGDDQDLPEEVLSRICQDFEEFRKLNQGASKQEDLSLFLFSKATKDLNPEKLSQEANK